MRRRREIARIAADVTRAQNAADESQLGSLIAESQRAAMKCAGRHGHRPLVLLLILIAPSKASQAP